MATPGLENLRDIHLPVPPHVALWQDIVGWLPLVLVTFVLTGVVAWLLPRWLRRQWSWLARWRALRDLNRLHRRYARDGDAGRFAQGLLDLLRQEARRRRPEDGLARLTGDELLAFLDRTGGNGSFCNGPGRCLATRPYQKEGSINADDVVPIVERWIRA